MIARGFFGHVRYYSFRTFFNLVLVVLLMPMFLVVALGITSTQSIEFPPDALSLSHFAQIFESPEWGASLGTSLIVASASALLATLIGTLAAVGLARIRLPGRIFLIGMVFAPVVVPTVVWALGLRFILDRLGLLGGFAGLILGHTVLTAPLVFIAVSLSLRSLPPRLLYAALSLGADAADTFRTITVPLIMPGVVGGVMIAFVTSFGEVALSFLLGNNVIDTLPVSLFDGARLNLDASQAAIGTLFIIAAALVTFGVAAVRRWHDRLWGVQ